MISDEMKVDIDQQGTRDWTDKVSLLITGRSHVGLSLAKQSLPAG